MNTADILRRHLPDTISQFADDDNVIIDCSCGTEIHGVMPPEPETTTGALMWLMADHLAEALRSGK